MKKFTQSSQQKHQHKKQDISQSERIECRKNVIRFITPTLLSSVCFFLFSVIDGVFVGRGVGVAGLGAVNLAMPFVLSINAIVMTITVGGASIIAIHIGRKETQQANEVFQNAMLFLLIAAVILCVIGTCFTGRLCSAMGATETYHKWCVDYVFWYSLFIIPEALSRGFQIFCRNDNAPGLVGKAVIISTVLNIFGDWLFIFPFHMGTMGAALATGISQVIGFLIMLSHFFQKKGILRLGFRKIDPVLWRKIIVHGLPEGISQLSTPIMILCTNLVLVAKIGDVGVNAFSIISYVASFSVAVFMGTGEGLQPLFGQSYGARKESHLRYYFRTGLTINVLGSMGLTILVILIARPLCLLYGADPVTLAYTLKVMPEYAWGFVIMGLNLMISAYLYSTERSRYAIAINVLRSLTVDVLIILLLPNLFGAGIIWYTFGIYEAIVCVIAILLTKYSERNGLVYVE